MGILDPGNFSPNQTFEEYSERFKDYFSIKRENGIIEVRMHENQGPTSWKNEHNFGWGPLLKAIGADLENEVLIIGGTGDVWTTTSRADGTYEKVMTWLKENPGSYAAMQVDLHQRVSKMMHSMLFDVDIPTIGVVNGPAEDHTELAFVCDVTLCAPNVEFQIPHFGLGIVPGDGSFSVFRHLIGEKRANYYAYTGEKFTAQEAKEWGMVNELYPSEEIYDKAWDIALSLMKQPRAVRRMTHEIMRKPMREFVSGQYDYDGLAEGFAGLCRLGE